MIISSIAWYYGDNYIIVLQLTVHQLVITMPWPCDKDVVLSNNLKYLYPLLLN